MPQRILVEPHPTLALSAFAAELPLPLAELPSPPALVALLDPAARAPVATDEALREGVRAMLRHGGYKPSGRGKPASEYLVRAAGEGGLRSINGAVDVCNAVSLHAGFPISVIDLDRARGQLRVRLGREGESYVFNASGQTIDVAGLVVLCDDEGPIANAVKDAQRTKTDGATTRTLSILWGTVADRTRLEAAAAWYRGLVDELLGGRVDLSSTEAVPAEVVS